MPLTTLSALMYAPVVDSETFSSSDLVVVIVVVVVAIGVAAGGGDDEEEDEDVQISKVMSLGKVGS